MCLFKKIWFHYCLQNSLLKQAKKYLPNILSLACNCSDKGSYLVFFLALDANLWSLRNEASCKAKWVQKYGQVDSSIWQGEVVGWERKNIGICNRGGLDFNLCHLLGGLTWKFYLTLNFIWKNRKNNIYLLICAKMEWEKYFIQSCIYIYIHIKPSIHSSSLLESFYFYPLLII